MIDKLKVLYPRFDDFGVIIEGSTVQIFFSEKDYHIPATRLSDGTLRYLSFLAILYSPNKPSLLCIEEPELGLHPDILPTIAKLLKEASEEVQIVVTTHSEVIIDTLTTSPEDVIVCENRNGATQMKRLCKEDLDDWLDRYTLGKLWSKGEIRGNDNSRLCAELRQGFQSLFISAGFSGKLPSVIASGSRNDAFSDFETAIKKIKKDETILLLVDSEDSVASTLTKWEHVQKRDSWNKPATANEDNLFFMVECMKSWFLADKEALKNFYGKGFHENSLPKTADLESIKKTAIIAALEKATQDTTKGIYGKGAHSFKILAVLDAKKVEKHGTYAEDFFNKTLTSEKRELIPNQVRDDEFYLISIFLDAFFPVLGTVIFNTPFSDSAEILFRSASSGNEKLC